MSKSKQVSTWGKFILHLIESCRDTMTSGRGGRAPRPPPATIEPCTLDDMSIANGKFHCPIPRCKFSVDKMASAKTHWRVTHEADLSIAGPSKHPRQPYLTSPPILFESGVLLLSFGDPNDRSLPHVLWCEECRSALPVDEIDRHWSRKSGYTEESQTHLHPYRPPKFDKDRVLMAFPALIQSAKEIEEIDLAPVAGVCARKIPHLIFDNIGFACKAPLCNAVSVSLIGFGNHVLRHTKIGYSAPTHRVAPYQRLGNRLNWCSFEVVDLGSEDVSEEQEAKIRSIKMLYERTKPTSFPSTQLNDPSEASPVYLDLGWAAMVDTFDPSHIAVLKRASKFQKDDRLFLLIRSVSNYLGVVGKDAQQPHRFHLACNVRSATRSVALAVVVK